jgi:hypothetical protein
MSHAFTRSSNSSVLQLTATLTSSAKGVSLARTSPNSRVSKTACLFFALLAIDTGHEAGDIVAFYKDAPCMSMPSRKRLQITSYSANYVHTQIVEK